MSSWSIETYLAHFLKKVISFMKMPSAQNAAIIRTLTTSLLVFLALSRGQALAQDSAVPAPILYSTEQVINEGDSPADIVQKAAKVFPRPNQTAWMRLERTFFLHFGVNTFNEVEWGSGREEPSLFNPAELDANQWLGAITNFGGTVDRQFLRFFTGGRERG